MHLDVVVGASVCTGATTDAVIVYDADLAVGFADNAVDGAEEADGVFTVAAGGREEEIAELESASV